MNYFYNNHVGDVLSAGDPAFWSWLKELRLGGVVFIDKVTYGILIHHHRHLQLTVF